MPDHIKSACYTLPKQMNEFLLQLLQIKKKALCSLLPCNLVKPEIRPAGFTREGGPLLLQRIRELTLKEAKHRQAMQAGTGPRAQITREETGKKEVSAESAALLRQELLNYNCEKKTLAGTLKIELEPGMPSIKQMEDRDRFQVE